MVPGSRHAMHNIEKVAGMSDNVSKTETTQFKKNSLLETSAKAHDGIDFDQFMSNDTMESTVSNDRHMVIHTMICPQNMQIRTFPFNL